MNTARGADSSVNEPVHEWIVNFDQGPEVQEVKTRIAQLQPGSAPDSGVVVQLRPPDVPRIARLGAISWPAPMQVDAATIARRFDLGHVMLGIERNGALLGLVAFSYSRWSPYRHDLFPSTDAEFSSQPRCERFDTIFAYNLVVDPEMRGSAISRQLIAAGLARARKDGCRWLLGHARCPSYNGSSVPGIELVAACAAFRHAIDQSLAGGVLPPLAQLLLDPILRFYHRTLRCTLVRVMPGFLPGDTASGGFAVRMVKDLQTPEGSLSASDRPRQ